MASSKMLDRSEPQLPICEMGVTAELGGNKLLGVLRGGVDDGRGHSCCLFVPGRVPGIVGAPFASLCAPAHSWGYRGERRPV